VTTIDIVLCYVIFCVIVLGAFLLKHIWQEGFAKTENDMNMLSSETNWVIKVLEDHIEKCQIESWNTTAKAILMTIRRRK
jgi:hypothetical protein